jgi:hypothetical protein
MGVKKFRQMSAELSSDTLYLNYPILLLERARLKLDLSAATFRLTLMAFTSKLKQMKLFNWSCGRMVMSRFSQFRRRLKVLSCPVTQKFLFSQLRGTHIPTFQTHMTRRTKVKLAPKRVTQSSLPKLLKVQSYDG